MTHRYCTSPIKIAKTFPAGRELRVMLMDASPGMLAGDRYELDWEVQAGAHLSVTNQGFTKVHPSQAGQGASSAARYRLGTDARVEAMMNPTMLYKDACFDNRTVVELGQGAVWMQGEVLCPGRALRGEAFEYERLDNRLTVYYDSELIHHQRQLILPGSHRIASPGAWRDYSHIGSFFIFSDRVTPVLLMTVRAVLEASGYTRERLLTGAALTWRHGLTVMFAASSAWIVQQAMAEVWMAVRMAL